MDKIKTRRSQSKDKTLRKGKELINEKLLSFEDASMLTEIEKNFSIAISPQMVNLIDKNIVNDPIAKQFVPSKNELNYTPAESLDPIGDDLHTQTKGIIHRYPDRCLLKPINVCAVYCRFCFRRDHVGPGNHALTKEELNRAFEYIKSHKEIWEIILTGGDPLFMKETSLQTIITQLDAIEHVKVIRFHTRVPVVDPTRVTDKLVEVLKNSNKTVYVVLHANHPKEFNKLSEDAIAKLVDSGIPMLSQSVLLAGINDDIDTLSQLMRCFIINRVKPYYLHHGDLAKGTSHFRTTIDKGQNLMQQLRGNFSGICQPTYVLDIPGGFGKVPINHNYLCKVDDVQQSKNHYQVEDYRGNLHNYHDYI